MTYVPFSVRRVIMAAQKVRTKQEQTKTANYELLEDILEGIITGPEV